MRSSARLVSALAAASFVFAPPMWAQYRQYTAPGALGERPEETREALERAVDEARWKLGPLRVEPVLGLSDLAYVDDGQPAVAGQDEGGDFTATATAGLRGYLPIGAHNTLALFAIPDYVWWKDQDELRRLEPAPRRRPLHLHQPARDRDQGAAARGPRLRHHPDGAAHRRAHRRLLRGPRDPDRLAHLGGRRRRALPLGEQPRRGGRRRAARAARPRGTALPGRPGAGT